MLFPKPQRMKVLSGKYKMKSEYPGQSLPDFFNAIKGGNQDVRINRIESLGEEEYILRISAAGVEISASCDVGIYRAATSLLQLINRCGNELSCVEIEDSPQFKRRGYMLEITCGRMPTPETLKGIIDFISALKYNELQLYMEGDCFKYSAYPKYTEGFECLTPQDIEELDAYCRERYIDLVPNQNSFGHLSPWLKYDEFKHLGLSDGSTPANTINPLEEESLEFVKNLYASLLPHFTSEYVNIGLDEAYGLGKYQTEGCDKAALYFDWLNKLAAVIKEKYGKKVMFWGDMIYKYSDKYSMIPENAVVMEWGYELIQSQMMTEHAMMFCDHGINYYVCPSVNTHNSFTGRFDVTSFNIRTSAEIGAKFGANGILLTDWGNTGHPQFHIWSALPCALCAQYAWNVGAEQDGENFKTDFIYAAERYVDDALFGGERISRLIYRMGNYYLLEPERVHVGTMCEQLMRYPIDQTRYAHFYDLKDSGDVFYFDNVIGYVKKVMSDFENQSFDPTLKREILLNSQMVVLASEICKIRIGCIPDAQKRDELVSMIDRIIPEFYTLWCGRNYEHGVELYTDILLARRQELLELKITARADNI